METELKFSTGTVEEVGRISKFSALTAVMWSFQRSGQQTLGHDTETCCLGRTLATPKLGVLTYLNTFGHQPIKFKVVEMIGHWC